MVQFCDKHRGNTIDSGTPFFMYRRQHHERVKLLNHHLGTSVRQTVHCSQHYAEAVEQWHTHAELVVLGEAHIFSGKVSVVRNAVVRQHHTLGKTCGTAGVLHVTNIVAIHLLLHFVQRLVLHVLTKQQQLCGIVHAAILLHTYINDVLQERETLAVQVAALAGLQFRQHGVGHVHIVTIPCAISDTQHLHVRVLTQILELVLLVVGVHCYQHRTYLGRSV